MIKFSRTVLFLLYHGGMDISARSVSYYNKEKNGESVERKIDCQRNPLS